MKATALRDMTQDEIDQKLKELREALFNLTFQHATGQLENTAQLTKTRRSIARALTVLRDKQQHAAA
ncbi:MAG: 50S ribosomal protein L29 [Syntrophobacteraceae bacterium]